MEKPVLIADMTTARPRESISAEGKPGHWCQVSYETVDGLKGVMLYADPEWDAPELVLPLEANGLYKIYLGINYTRSAYADKILHLEWSLYGQLEVRLTDDPGFRKVGAEINWLHDDHLPQKMGKAGEMYRSVQEAYWKTAELTGQSLCFRPAGPPANHPDLRDFANLSYIKLVPVTSKEAAIEEELQPVIESRTLAMMYCTGSLTGHTHGTFTYHPTSRDWFTNEIAPCVSNDIGVFIFEAIRGNFCTFKTSIGDVGSRDNTWDPSWFDPLEGFTAAAHENNLEIFVAMRMIGAQYPMIDAPIGRALHYRKHQKEWAKRDREGRPTANLSIAYDGVREYWLGLLREVLDYGVDGIQLHLNRSYPFVLFEDPVVRSFMDEFGEDPRLLKENDIRWVRHGAGYLNAFIREIRALVDEKPGRKLGITFFGRASKYDAPEGFDPILYGCDVDTWIIEGLVDYLMPTPSVDPDLIRRWRKLGGGDIHIWPDLMPRTQPGSEYVRLARKYHDAGADGLCLWDGERRTGHISEWATVCRLGHDSHFDYLEKEARNHYRRVELKYLNGMNVPYSFRDG